MKLARNLIAIFWAPALVYFLQLARQEWLYGMNQFDPIAHFFGGFAIAYSALVALKLTYPRVQVPTSLWVMLLVLIGAFVGILWEWYEFFRFRYDPSPLLANWPWWPDTLYDLFMDSLGAGLYAVIAVMRKKI